MLRKLKFTSEINKIQITQKQGAQPPQGQSNSEPNSINMIHNQEQRKQQEEHRLNQIKSENTKLLKKGTKFT